MTKLFKRLLDFILGLFKKSKANYLAYKQNDEAPSKHGLYIKQSRCGMNMNKCKLKYY